MYSYISGLLKAKLQGAAVVDNNGIGYRINTTDRALSSLESGREVTFHTHLYVREEVMALYGFPESESVALFELLLTVSGIGPRAGLAICEMGSAAQVYGAIVSRDISWLVRAQGIGKKTAERLVLELREKISKDMALADTGQGSGAAVAGADVASQAHSALVGLGYQAQEVEPLVVQAHALLGPSATVESILRTVLRNIAQGR